MKRLFPIWIAAMGLLAACGEDRSGECYAIIADRVNGLAPDLVVREIESAVRWKALGDTDELLFNKALQIIAAETPSDAEGLRMNLSKTSSSLSPSSSSSS
ncbi:MAG: hypothetical protein Q4E55_00805 [Bacteroidales bacterium]|nr:hypothetical protein [Bacteroidales bacterium]